MDKKSGKWGTSHPRYRLLEALWAYTNYRERHMAELDRWRSLYKSTGKKQKKVSGPWMLFSQSLMMP
jgi:carnosine N-methyltransferase